MSWQFKVLEEKYTNSISRSKSVIDLCASKVEFFRKFQEDLDQSWQFCEGEIFPHSRKVKCDGQNPIKAHHN